MEIKITTKFKIMAKIKNEDCSVRLEKTAQIGMVDCSCSAVSTDGYKNKFI